jgi:hypothetical protein
VKTKAAKHQGWSKQKKQFVALGALTLLLAVVIGMQFRESETEYQVAALSEDAVAVTDAPAVEASDSPAEPEAHDNPVLSQAPAEPTLGGNPFTSFWNRETSTSTAAPSSFPAPSVVLGITIPGGDRPVAVIDGDLHFVGDLVQGWRLEEVHARSVVLRSPAQEQLVVEMPLFQSSLVVPATDSAPR